MSGELPVCCDRFLEATGCCDAATCEPTLTPKLGAQAGAPHIGSSAIRIFRFFFSHSPTNLASSCFLFSYRPLDVTSRTVPDLVAHVQRKSLAQNHDASRMCAQVSEPIVHAARRSLRFRSPLPSFLRPSLLVTHTPDAHTVFDPPDGPLPFLPPPRSRKSFSAAWKPLR